MISMEDERAITGVLHDYATGIDTRNWTLFRTAFADAIVADYGPFGMWISGDAITAAMTKMHLSLGPTLHRISNIVIRRADEGARVRSYVDAILRGLTDSAPTSRACGIYEDMFKCEAGRWVIAERRFAPVLMG